MATVKRNEDDSLIFTPLRDFYVVNGMELYAAPVRTKDLTDAELRQVLDRNCGDGLMAIARAVIQEYRRKNGIV